MSTWNSRGLRLHPRGYDQPDERAVFESGLALIQKIPTPITPINIDKIQTHYLSLFLTSTVDYNGAVQGIPVCFDAARMRRGSFCTSEYP